MMANSTGGFPRPFGVTLIAFVTLASAVLPLVAAARVRTPETLPAPQAAEMRRKVQVPGIWAAVGLVAAAGLFGLRRWGWWLALGYHAGTVPLLALRQSSPSAGELVFQIGLSVLVIWYLTSRDIRIAFLRR